MPAPQYTRNQILTQNTNDFPNNNAGLITPAILRDYNANVANSVVFRDEPIDNAVSASFATFALTASYTLGSIATASYADNAGKLDGLDSTSFVFTSSYNITSASISTRLTAQEQFSSSLDATFATDAELNAVSSSITSRLTTDELSISSLNAATSSFVRNNQTSSMSVLSASYANFAASIPTNLNITASNILVSQNLTVNGATSVNSITASNALVTSASIAYLQVIYQTSSIIVSSGSNIFGDQANDVQTLWGTVDIKTGPVLVTGSLNVSSGITGSLLGTASYALNALTASFASNAGTVSTLGTTLFSTSPSNGGNFSTSNGIFLGSNAGSGSSAANQSIFLGLSAGRNATSAFDSVFLGTNTGENSAASNNSIFIGGAAGRNTAADGTVFIGDSSGNAATNARSSVFLGTSAGSAAAHASRSVFIGSSAAGNTNASAAHSTIIGWQAGLNPGNSGLRGFNIIIGQNVTLPESASRAINIGGIIYGTGSWNGVGNTATFNPEGNGRIGINILQPQYNLDVSGSGNYTSTLTVTGSVTSIAGFTGSLLGTASFATNVSSASYALSSSFAVNSLTASVVATTTDNGNTQHKVLFVNSGASAGEPLLTDPGNFTYNPNQGLLTVTASYSNQALSSSFATNASTASFLLGTVLSASYAISASRAETAGTAATASFVLNAISSSYSLSSSISDTSISASFALNANTASYVLNAISASFATTASFLSGTVTSASYALSSSFSLTASFFAGTVTSASFASTASFINSLNQAVVITGSVQGNVTSASISSATSSIDFSQGSFFTSLVSGSTFFNITNPRRGQTVNLLLTTAGIATASFSSNVKQVSGSRYTPTSGSGLNDIITFISWDGTTVYLSNVKNLI